jgi:hypothetical protein
MKQLIEQISRRVMHCPDGQHSVYGKCRDLPRVSKAQKKKLAKKRAERAKHRSLEGFIAAQPPRHRSGRKVR